MVEAYKLEPKEPAELKQTKSLQAVFLEAEYIEDGENEDLNQETTLFSHPPGEDNLFYSRHQPLAQIENEEEFFIPVKAKFWGKFLTINFLVIIVGSALGAAIAYGILAGDLDTFYQMVKKWRGK